MPVARQPLQPAHGQVVDEPADVNLRTYTVRVDGDDVWLSLA